MAGYYPAVICNILLRYDEALEVVNMPEPQPQSGEFDADLSTGHAAFLNRNAREPERSSVVEPLITVTGTEDTASQFLNIVPKTCAIELPGYRTAGTFAVRVQWRELPIDPRMVRAALVQIFQGTVEPANFADGMLAGRHHYTEGQPAVLDYTLPGGAVDEDKLAMVGLVDSWKVTHDASGSYVSFEGRDLRGVLLDSPVNPKILSQLKYDQPLDKVVEDLISTHPMYKAKYFKGPVIEKKEWKDERIPSPYDNEIRPSRGASGKKGKVGVQTGSANYWDIITNLCFRVGAIPYMQNQTLKIRPARSIFDQQRPTNDERAPFVDRYGVRGPRQDEDGNKFYVRRMVHGRNIEQLNFERKFTGVKVPIIECIATDHSSAQRGMKKLLKVQVPSKKELAALVGSVSPDGLVSQTEVQQIPVQGVRSIERLEEIAKNLYEEIGQGEMGGSIKTKSLASFLGKPAAFASGDIPVDSGNADPDLLTMRPGDAIEILVDIRQISSKAPIANEFTDHHRRDFNEQVAAVQLAFKNKGSNLDINTARVLVASSRSDVIDVLNFFRVYNIRFNWTNGIVDISFDFHNYFVARYSILETLANIDAEPRSQERTKRKRRKPKKKAPTTTPKRYNTDKVAGSNRYPPITGVPPVKS